MGHIYSICCSFKEEPQKANAFVESLLWDIQASHQSQQPHSSSPLFNMTTGRNSTNVSFFLYTEGAIVPQDPTHVGVRPSVTVIPWDVTHGHVHRSVAAILSEAFRGCRHLKVVLLPEGLQKIGARAFMNCPSLEQITFPSTLTAIGDYAFGCCTSLRDVDLSNVKTIGMSAFYGCNSLERMKFPSTLTVIGHDAFEGCIALREVELTGGILDIGTGAFSRCTLLEQIAIPFKALVVEADANHNCRLLTSGTITPTDDGLVVIDSEFLNYMSVTYLAEVANRINAITNYQVQTREENLERIRVLFVYYGLVEATTILELALWKAKVDEFDDLNARTRDKCRFTWREECRGLCGADGVIPTVMSFL